MSQTLHTTKVNINEVYLRWANPWKGIAIGIFFNGAPDKVGIGNVRYLEESRLPMLFPQHNFHNEVTILHTLPHLKRIG